MTTCGKTEEFRVDVELHYGALSPFLFVVVMRDRKEVKEKYERIVYERLREARTAVRKETSVNDVFSLFKGVVTTVAAEVVGYRVVKGGRKGNAWWTQEIKEAT